MAKGNAGTAHEHMDKSRFIFTMRDLRRFYPPDREVLKGINLSMWPGAKIGVLGSNGSGKSSLLKIMAGEDDGFTGEARLTPGFTVGYLAQEPHLNPAKDVLGNVKEGVAAVAALIDRYNAVCESMGDPDADFDKLLAEQADLQDKIDARERVGPRPSARDLDGGAALPSVATPTSPRCPVARSAGSRCASCCCRSPTCCCSTSRRTTSTPSRSRGWSGS